MNQKMELKSWTKSYFREEYFIKAVKSNADSSSTYLSPFTPGVWLLVFLTYLVFCAGFFISLHYGQNIFEEHDFNIGLCTLIMANGLLLQGTPHEPKKFSSRIIFAHVFMTGIIFSTSYSACLTSFLAVVKVKFPFTDDESLYYDSPYTIVTVDGSGYVDAYKVNKSDNIF